MNYDPIHDTYSAPEHSSPNGHEKAALQSQELSSGEVRNAAEGGVNSGEQGSPAAARTGTLPIGQAAGGSLEEKAVSAPSIPKREDAPYKPFSIDSLMGGTDSAPADEANVFAQGGGGHQGGLGGSGAAEAHQNALPPISPPRAQNAENPALQAVSAISRASVAAVVDPPAADHAIADRSAAELPPTSNFQHDPALLPQGADPAPSQGADTSFSAETRDLPPDFREISRGYKYLKKSDGEPFWRKDIQYDFLNEVFSDETRCFTNYFPFCEVTNAANEPKLTFAELYVRTLAESNKSSKILRERLIKEKDMGIAVSKVCLLVNAGRMNTTVNFVPDMRSALRTYHSIPSLQTTGSGDSRPLQDTPRLKTILKAVCDDQKHLLTLLDLFKNRNEHKPNTNVIKLIFLMSTFFQNIPFHYDDSYEHDSFSEKFRFIKASPGPQNKFMEFFLNDEIHPKCRSRRFLWLMYTYLETSFTAGEVAENPFNPHVIPPLEYIPESELGNYDVDTDYEIKYAIHTYHTRMMHLSADAHNPLPKKGNKSRRERQKILSQLNDGSGQSPAPQTDGGDDSMNADDTTMIGHEDTSQIIKPEPTIEKFDPVVTSLPNPGQATSPSSISGAATAPGPASAPASTPASQEKPSSEKVHKRKRPAPSVGSLVEETRKPVLDEESQKLTTPEFPIEGLEEIIKAFATSTPSNLYKSLAKDGPLSAAQKKSIVNKSRGLIDQVSKTIPRKFEATREALLRWVKESFYYRVSVGSGLLGIEWEDIRSDVSNGIEAYLYQQLGKEVLIQKYERTRDDEEYDVDKSFATQSSKLGDAAPIDMGEIDKAENNFVPKRDFNKVNERTQFELTLLELLSATIAKKKTKRPKFNRISFDLDKGSISIK